MDHSAKGIAALDASNPVDAAAHFTRALINHPTSPDYFTHRATAFSRFKPARHDLALRDAEYAILFGQRRQKREKIQAAQQRRVVSLYGLGRYEDAKVVLMNMVKWRSKEKKPDKMEHDMWLARIKTKLKDSDTQAESKIKEYPEIALPDEKEMKSWLQSQLNSDGTFRLDRKPDAETGIAASSSISQDETVRLDAADEADVRAAKAEMKAAETQTSKPQPIRQDWYQDNNSVTVTLFAKKVDSGQLKSKFEEDFVEVTFPHPDGSTNHFLLTLDPTFASIEPTTSTVKATPTKVELKLMKKAKGVKWPALDDKSRPKTDKLPSAWTTKGSQDWDKKAAELNKKKEKKKDQKTDGDNSDSDADSEFGGDAVDGFFKKLYAGADEDTRKAMMKSFQESNGTALSTNWSEVSKGKVDEVKSKDT